MEHLAGWLTHLNHWYRQLFCSDHDWKKRGLGRRCSKCGLTELGVYRWYE